MAYKDMEKKRKAMQRCNTDNMAKYDRLNILVPKGEREKIKHANIDIEVISQCTGLSIEEVWAL